MAQSKSTISRRLQQSRRKHEQRRAGKKKKLGPGNLIRNRSIAQAKSFLVRSKYHAS